MMSVNHKNQLRMEVSYNYKNNFQIKQSNKNNKIKIKIHSYNNKYQRKVKYLLEN